MFGLYFNCKKVKTTMKKNLQWRFGIILNVARHPWLFSKRIAYGFKRLIFNKMNRFGYHAYKYKIIFIAGLPLSGTTWVKNLFARVPGYFTCRMPMPAEVAYRQDICDSAFKYISKYGYTLIKTHLNPTEDNLECIRKHGVEKIIVVYRDLRDVVISHYYRLLSIPKPKDAYDYLDIKQVGCEGLMDYCIENAAGECMDWIRGWFELAKKEPQKYFFIRYEDLHSDTKGIFVEALKHYNIELNDWQIERIIERSKGKGNMKRNMEMAKITPFGYASNFRSGKIGSWRHELSEVQMSKCRALLGPALIELGYEKNLNW